jgi:PAS domain S-box-containing protein
MSERKPLVMVVDDNPVSRYTTRRVLEHARLDVVDAASGGQALELAHGGIDLYVLDVHLPDIHGFELCQALRKLSPVSRTPILHLSAVHVSDADKIRGLDEGADAYLTHPVDPGVLVSTINAFLRARDAERALRLSEEKFRSIHQEIPSGVGLFDDTLVLSEANPALCALVGKTRDELVGARLPDALGAAPATLDAISQAVRVAGAWRGIVAIDRADGERLELDVAISTLPVFGLRLIVATDISARRRLEAERVRLLEGERVARDEAERANQTKDDFLATLSHELRNPLNSIVGWANVLQRVEARQQIDEGLAAIQRNARVQAQLINDLLDLSRITSGKMAVTIGTVDWRVAIQSALHAFERDIGTKELVIELAIGDAPVPVLADESRLQQIIWNLLSNAIKFSSTGGRVRIALETDDEYARMTISDEGVGIAPDLLPYIFERFRQGDSSTRRAHGGLGIGLAIVNSLVGLHQGDITVHSAGKMQGATFVVRLRRADVADVTSAGAAAALGSDELAGLHLLVVDDNPDAARIMERILRDAGAQVRTATSAADALAAVSAHVPDVMISDIGMPDMDGYDLIRTLRGAGYSSERMPAIAVTALARDNDQEEALAAGYQRHLAKPFATHEVIRAVLALAKQ